MGPPFRLCTRCHIVGDLGHTSVDPTRRKAANMEPNQHVEDTELVTETLVEEVSIDGMCGVY
ncbi:mycofactocin precursor [Mycobacterium sp. 852013-51886_SCH5428379]|nr:mycofactocin precursor [Mycobacterium sp. 852013-51886_SCH5428379]